MATQPRGDHTHDESPARPHLVDHPTRRRTSGALWVVIGLVVIAAIAVIGYFLLYNGNGGYGGGTGGGGGAGGGGAGGGGYVFLALSADHVRRVLTRRRSRTQ
jgi:hypothetical protein